MRNVPEKCPKCRQRWKRIHWHHDAVNVIVNYSVMNEELVVKCGRCSYITCCDPDDKETKNASNT